MRLFNPKSSAKNEINVTPLVDVVLVLLIVFMVVTPMLQRGQHVSLPSTPPNPFEKTTPTKLETLVVSITQEKTLFMGDKQVSKKALKEEIQQLQSNGWKKILLKGDKTLPFEEVRSVLEILQQTGFRHIALAVEERKES
ncbi:MAG: biopolymer transporter ExbD [Proteobacteria bacterium]|nr:biopolymer transporter ExbD [Cystobacterineae bacterium]MCL2258490.1 biopolymer transporter ExbD [Cystobacterineae bacterium]MCL2315170.1 biopolymer transporter ExbD [Pseudomonadota bacterium]